MQNAAFQTALFYISEQHDASFMNESTVTWFGSVAMTPLIYLLTVTFWSFHFL